MNWFKLLMSCEGRIDRKTFLIGLAPVAALVGLLWIYAGYVLGALPGFDWLVMALIGLEALYFLVCLSRKRLRDYGRPGWFILLLLSPLFVSAFFLLQQKYMPTQSHELPVVLYTIAIVMALVFFFWVLVEMLFRRTAESA